MNMDLEHSFDSVWKLKTGNFKYHFIHDDALYLFIYFSSTDIF